MNGQTNHFYEFGPFRFDPEEHALVRNGEPVSLPPRVTETLSVLLQNAGHLVEKDKLIKEVWTDAVVEEGNLNKNIFMLRKALGQWDGGREYIETVPKRGYRFVGPVNRSIAQAVVPTASNTEFEKSRTRWGLMRGFSAGMVVLLSTLGAWRLSKRSADVSLPPIEAVPLVALQRSQASPAFSPDGNQVAFGGYEGEDGAIYTALVGGDKPLRLTRESGVCCPTWSPDGRQIAFFRFLKEAMSINVVSALGGAEKTLYAGIEGFRGMCGTMDWSPDGKWLAFGESRNKGFHSRIALLSLDDLTVKELTSPIDQEYDCEPAFSPDGSSVAFERGSLGGFAKDLFVIPALGGQLRRLTFDNAWGGTPAWTHDGTEIVFSSNRGGLLSLWRISAAGGAPRPVAGVSALAYHPTIPRKGDVLAYEHATLSGGIWKISINEKAHPLGPALHVLAARGMIDFRPSFSPDGQKIVFESDRLGYSDIWYCDRDGSNCTQLTSMHGTAGTARWSPDGQHVVFEFQSRHYYDIYVVDVPSGRPRLLPTFPESDNGAPNWSRDGKWIYFYSSHEKGHLQLWKVPVQGGPPVRVTSEGGVYATESADGRFLYYSKFEQPGVWRMALIGGQEERILDQPEGYNWFNWALSPTGIYFRGTTGAEKGRIEFFDFKTHKRTFIADVEKLTHGLALAPDGRTILYGQNDSEDYDIMLVKNFH